MLRNLALLLLLPLLALAADPHRIHRSTAARRATSNVSIRAQLPDNPTGPCPGYVIDHIRALACGGEDAPPNMQWQTRGEAKQKDRTERHDCGR